MTNKPHFIHQPVLVDEIIASCKPKTGDQVLDMTVGLGGHAKAILDQIGPSGHLIGIDQDPQALAICEQTLADHQNVTLLHGNFSQVADLAEHQTFDLIIADLGVSSLQLDDTSRGFSFHSEAPLDMRMDTSSEKTETKLLNFLNTSDEKTLCDTIFHLGEEKKARRVARSIYQKRPINTTKELTEAILQAIPPRSNDKLHPATKTFQALRIYVNRELEVLQEGLEQAISLLNSNGHLAVISFHSLEDRIVKQLFAEKSRDYIDDPIYGHKKIAPTHKLLNKKPIIASPTEIALNPRSSSAKLRILIKL